MPSHTTPANPYSAVCMNDENKNTEDTPDETEMLRQENERLKQQMRLGEIRDSVTTELTRAGAHSADLLFDLLRERLRFDDDDKPENVAELIASIRTEFPMQFEQTSAEGSIDAGSGTSGRTAFLSPEALAKMTPAEIKRLDWTEVRQVLAGGK